MIVLFACRLVCVCVCVCVLHVPQRLFDIKGRLHTSIVCTGLLDKPNLLLLSMVCVSAYVHVCVWFTVTNLCHLLC